MNGECVAYATAGVEYVMAPLLLLRAQAAAAQLQALDTA